MRMTRPQLATVATCALDQWALDFEGNKHRIIESCKRAKSLGARYRLGPELEISGYGCEDHFLEGDTLDHSIEVLRELLNAGCTDDMFCDFGLPILHNGVRYNVRAMCLNREILCLRPKQVLADDGNYRESRWFSRWTRACQVDDHVLDSRLAEFSRGGVVPFGDVCVRLRDASIGVESCEELFAPDSPHIRYNLCGIDIIGNGSGSHHQLRKLDTRVNLIINATRKNGGTYLYANQTGCDGGRLGFDGCAMIASKGDLLAQGSQFTISDVEVVCATIDLNAARTMRAVSAARNVQATRATNEVVPQILVDDWSLCGPSTSRATLPILAKYHSPEEEIAFGPAVWLWDYLRRSGASGFFIPLSGGTRFQRPKTGFQRTNGNASTGADSASVVAIVFSMCRMISTAIQKGDETVVADVQRITNVSSLEVLKDPRALANVLLHSAYLSTENSSQRTRGLASNLAKETGHYHLEIDIMKPVQAIIEILSNVVQGRQIKYKIHGGSETENLALQNIQARIRMIASYAIAQLIPWSRFGRGYLLVLSSANVDEGLRGYLTKYDCSSGDLNPIGAVSKLDLRRFLSWGANHLELPTLRTIVAQKSSPELEPITEAHSQVSEDDMGCSFEELSLFGRLRKQHFLGPLYMYRRLSQHEWSHLPRTQVASKVKFLFTKYSTTRHKMTVLTPSYHCEAYSPEDHRFDLRPFLYRNDWDYQFRLIDVEVQELPRIHKTSRHDLVLKPPRPILGGPFMHKRFFVSIPRQVTQFDRKQQLQIEGNLSFKHVGWGGIPRVFRLLKMKIRVAKW